MSFSFRPTYIRFWVTRLPHKWAGLPKQENKVIGEESRSPPIYISGCRLINTIWKSEKSVRSGRIRQGEGIAKH